MSGTIYAISDSGELLPLTEAAYDSEAVLQELLAKYPSLLAGEQIDSKEPRRWLLVKREIGVPAGEGTDRWAVDHLFLDQEGIPTIVEVKRSRDTRIRREVIGQMLEYAANAVTYWPLERLQAEFKQTCEREGRQPSEALVEVVGPEADEESFWQQVKTNLQAGRVRMVFVADEIPSELRRVIEFLNQQTDPAQVLGLEIKQFAGEGLKTLVPRVIGMTAQAEVKKASREKRQWDEESFFAELQEQRGEEEATAGRRVFEWAKLRGLSIRWGRGQVAGSMYPALHHPDGLHWLFSLWTYGRINVEFGRMSQRGILSEEVQTQIAQRLNEIPGIDLPVPARLYPSFPLAALSEPEALEHFRGVFDWVIDLITDRSGDQPRQIDPHP